MELKLQTENHFGFSSLLLIVPYGIEIVQTFLRVFLILPFNRTLWN